tara:strand:+ start:1489 stop:2598 length:1110 start_codon:yes stop_codon:yes gene_type:complete
MSKTIKIVARMGGEDVLVGRCHPGQARILRKNNMADFDKGVLVLRAVPPASIVRVDEQKIPEGWAPTGNRMYTKEFKECGSWKDENIDPEGLLGSDRPHPVEKQVDSLEAWVNEIKVRRAAGHFMIPADDPMRRMLGFVDDEANEWVGLGLSAMKVGLDLSAMKRTSNDTFEGADVVREACRTYAGRYQLVSGVPLPSEDDKEAARQAELVAAEVPSLEDILIQEVEETLGAEVREAMGTRLVDKWANEALAEGATPWAEAFVRSLCGILPRKEFLDQRDLILPCHPEHGDRQTGRTTEMLVQAVVCALNGESVVIRARTKVFTDTLVRQAREMALKCGRPHVKIEGFPKAGDATRLRGRDVQIFRDHY